MLNAAKDLFLENGYSRTTMDEIADRAGFGIATLYNYFKTKEGMFAAMAYDDMSELKALGEKALTNIPSDPTHAVTKIMKIYLKVFDYISYSVMKEFIFQSNSKGPLHEVSEWTLSWEREQIRLALAHCQNSKTLKSEMDIDLMSYILVDLLIRHIQRLSGINGHQHSFKELKSSVNLVLSGWSSSKC